MNLRPVKNTDLNQIAQLYFHTVRNINSRDYSNQQIEIWADTIKAEEFWQKRFENYTVYVVESDDEIVGFAEYQYPGHIDCFYVHHEYQRQGVGKLLLDGIEKTAKKEKTTRLFVDASITAKPFFLAQGFNELKQQIKIVNEVSFELFFMEKWL